MVILQTSFTVSHAFTTTSYSAKKKKSLPSTKLVSSALPLFFSEKSLDKSLVLRSRNVYSLIRTNFFIWENIFWVSTPMRDNWTNAISGGATTTTGLGIRFISGEAAHWFRVKTSCGGYQRPHRPPKGIGDWRERGPHKKGYLVARNWYVVIHASNHAF